MKLNHHQFPSTAAFAALHRSVGCKCKIMWAWQELQGEEAKASEVSAAIWKVLGRCFQQDALRTDYPWRESAESTDLFSGDRRYFRISRISWFYKWLRTYHALGLLPWKRLLRLLKQVKQKLTKSAEDLERDAGSPKGNRINETKFIKVLLVNKVTSYTTDFEESGSM